MLRNGLAQGKAALAVYRLQELFSEVQHHLPLKSTPNGKGKMGGAVGYQIQRRRRGRFRRNFRSGVFGRGIISCLHEIAHLFPGADVALRQQKSVGGFHSDFADFQMLRQRSL